MNSEQDFAIIKLSERVYIANSSSLLFFQSHSRETLIRSHSKGSLLRVKVASFIGIVVAASAGLIVCLRETSVKKAKKARSLSPPIGATRRIASVADEVRRR